MSIERQRELLQKAIQTNNSVIRYKEDEILLLQAENNATKYIVHELCKSLNALPKESSDE